VLLRARVREHCDLLLLLDVGPDPSFLESDESDLGSIQVNDRHQGPFTWLLLISVSVLWRSIVT
jgi:hypothetical protein